jgi:hypothetical protein
MKPPMKPGRGWREKLEEEAALARLAQRRAIPVRRAAPPIDQAPRKALGPILQAAGPAPGTLAARWPEIVGERLAKVTEPIKVTPARGGAILTIRAPSAAAPMIQHAREHIIERVNLTGAAKIKDLKIVQTAARPEAKPPARPRALTREEHARLAHDLGAIETPAIRNALANLGEAILTSRSKT